MVTLFTQENLKKAINALVVTFAIAALFHLTTVTAVAIYQHSLSYLNPLDFLGVSILFPQYRESRLVAGFGWLVLVMLFFFILLIRVRYHVYVALMRETKVGKRISKVSYGLKAVLPSVPEAKKTPPRK